jgi:glycosyltransferase involved in cell wall biosynthesis
MHITLVTICILGFMGKEFIADTIQSAPDQTYASLEIILVDECSPDKT